VAKAADQLVVMLGISSNIETEGHDRTNTTLPGVQEELALQLLALNKPTVVVLLNGGIVSVDALLAKALPSNPPAIVEAWNPGVRGGVAIAKALFGATNRWGKLPVTVYASSFSSLVDMLDMSMTSGLGRTCEYRVHCTRNHSWINQAPRWNVLLKESLLAACDHTQTSTGPAPNHSSSSAMASRSRALR
jgi:hypothetical protein